MARRKGEYPKLSTKKVLFHLVAIYEKIKYDRHEHRL